MLHATSNLLLKRQELFSFTTYFRVYICSEGSVFPCIIAIALLVNYVTLNSCQLEKLLNINSETNNELDMVCFLQFLF